MWYSCYDRTNAHQRILKSDTGGRTRNHFPVNSVQHQSDKRLSGADTFLSTQNPSSVDVLFLGILQFNMIKTNLKARLYNSNYLRVSPNNPEMPESQ